MPEKIFINENGSMYYILFGGRGKKSLLCKINNNNEPQEYVICEMLEIRTWWQGTYFEKFEEAYNSWKGNENE